MSKTYSEKLRDPRWQKKRLEVMSRDDFTCQFCEDKESTLNVHHIRYIRGHKPWEYEPYYLITLCESCHEGESNRQLDESGLTGSFALAGSSTEDVNSIAVDLYEILRHDRKAALALIKDFKRLAANKFNELMRKKHIYG